MKLAQDAYLQQQESILMAENPGLGKTHIAIGLGASACLQAHRVRFYRVTNPANELQDAHVNDQLPKFLDKILHYQLVIMDAFGYAPFSSTGAQLLFQFCATRHERVSLIVTTNLPFSDWVQVLGNERMDYARYRQLGLPIGSGTVKSACKTVVQACMKQAGMRWSRSGAQSMLALRCLLLSDRWDEFPSPL